jgi:hypothetical protein
MPRLPPCTECKTVLRIREQELGSATSFLYPAYLRGEAFLELHRGGDAAMEFQKFFDHRAIVANCPLGRLLPHALERRRPRHPHPEASQSRVREAAVAHPTTRRGGFGALSIILDAFRPRLPALLAISGGSSHASSATKDPHGSRRVANEHRFGVRESVILGTNLFAVDIPQFSPPAKASSQSPPEATDR